MCHKTSPGFPSSVVCYVTLAISVWTKNMLIVQFFSFCQLTVFYYRAFISSIDQVAHIELAPVPASIANQRGALVLNPTLYVLLSVSWNFWCLKLDSDIKLDIKKKMFIFFFSSMSALCICAHVVRAIWVGTIVIKTWEKRQFPL